MSQVWLSRRIGRNTDVELTVEEIADMAEALDVPVQGLLMVVLPRLDSNQQPSGYVSALARAHEAWGMAA